MGKAIMNAVLSLDGFIADPSDRPGPLFDWYSNGDVPVTLGDPDRVFHTSAASAEYLRSVAATVGATVIGRRLFDITDGWQGRPAAGEHVFVVTHEPPTDWKYAASAPFTFVTGGVRSAVEQARAFAGDRDVAVTAGDIGGQALRAGVIDQIALNLAPVLLGSGIPFFGTGGVADPVLLEDPRIVAGTRVLHLVYDVRR
jgi:dihydrofolate reductase